MSDRNRMLQGNVMPVAVVGAISGKAMLDTELVNQFKRNSANPRTKPFCYPGGEDQINANVMQYDTAIGMRNVRELDGFDGEPAELAIVGIGGLNWSQYCSQAQMQRDYYWLGIVTTESRLFNPYDPGTMDAIHQGFGFIRAGTHTVANNGNKNFYPGQRIRWRLPLAPFHPKGNESMPTLCEVNRAGRPPSQWQAEYVPFDPLDMTDHMASAYALMTVNADQGGVADLAYADALPHLTGFRDVRPHDPLQEEAISYKFGISAIGLAFVQALADRGVITFSNLGADIPEEPRLNADQRKQNFNDCASIAEKLGLSDPSSGGNDKRKVLHSILADVMMSDISPIDPEGEKAKKRFRESVTVPADKIDGIPFSTPATKEGLYASMRYHAMSLMTQGILGSFDDAHDSVVGRALNASAPGDDLHGLWGHFC
jgi:hypothetical protein